MATTAPSKFLSPSKQFLETNRAFFKMILGASATEGDIRRHAKEQWKALSSKERKPYVEMRNADKARYEFEMNRLQESQRAQFQERTITLEHRVLALEEENREMKEQIASLEAQVLALSTPEEEEEYNDESEPEVPEPPEIVLEPLPATDKRVRRIKPWNLTPEKLFITTNIDERAEWEFHYGTMSGSGLKDICRRQAKKELKSIWISLTTQKQSKFLERCV